MKKKILKKSVRSNTFHRNHHARKQGADRESAGFGDEERTHVDTVKLTEKLETLETSRSVGISGDMAGY